MCKDREGITEAPKAPVEPVLSQDPVLTLERRVGRDSVLEVFYNSWDKYKQTDNVE